MSYEMQQTSSREKGKRDTNRIGAISEAAIIIRFLQLDYTVLTPFGGNQRADLLIENSEGRFLRVQCKTGHIDKNGTAILFNTAIRNVTGKHRQSRDYRGECDYFAVYNERLNKVYLISVDQAGIPYERLQLTPTKGKQKREILWAKDYEL